jgi:protein-tyrosine phosphatase
VIVVLLKTAEDEYPSVSAETADPTAIPIEFDPVRQLMTGVTMHGGKHFSVPFMTEISRNLWQGGCADGLVLPPAIDHLVNLYIYENYTVRHSLKSALSVEMLDATDQDMDQVLDIASWVNSCRRTGTVLVHCQAGLNRSALVAGAAMVLAEEMTGEQAVDRIREQRSAACLCNPAFERWLAGLDFAATRSSARSLLAEISDAQCRDLAGLLIDTAPQETFPVIGDFWAQEAEIADPRFREPA